MSQAQPTHPRVRFAPSPTGYLHVGGARTALFNWLFARHFGGTFILRIEDTDVARSTQQMVDVIVEAMHWIGLDYDEGPFFQSQRGELYRQAGEKLLLSGHAYHCFCTREQLEGRRAEAAEAGKPPIYDRRCRDLSAAETQARRNNGESAALRFKVPTEGTTAWEDAVFGRIEFANTEIEDFVLLRSDGVPTYHLSVVTDDVDMRMTHIIRGADHISNTPKQILIYQAMQAAMPVFAHVPLILGPDKTRLSKRHGATSVTAYRDMGIVPEAFRNFLALLGWSPGQVKDANGKDRELFTGDELKQMFSLDGVSKSNAVFSNEKLAWFNTEYIRNFAPEALLPLIQPEWARAEMHFALTEPEILARIALLQQRARSLADFAGAFRGYFMDDFEFDPAAVAKFLADPLTRSRLVTLASRYEEQSGFTEASTEATLRAYAAEAGIKPGVLINGARVAITGQGVAPSLFAVMAVLGRERTIARLHRAAEIPDAEIPESETQKTAVA